MNIKSRVGFYIKFLLTEFKISLKICSVRLKIVLETDKQLQIFIEILLLQAESGI